MSHPICRLFVHHATQIRVYRYDQKLHKQSSIERHIVKVDSLRRVMDKGLAWLRIA